VINPYSLIDKFPVLFSFEWREKSGLNEKEGNLSVITVLGEIDEDTLGITDPHNHLLVDIRCQFSEFKQVSKKDLSEEKVRIENLGILSRNPYAIKDNLWLNDVGLAEEELRSFKKAGGRTFVDATPRDMGRDPEALRDIAVGLGMNIIAGCGYYTYDTHPEDISKKTIEEIAEEMINDINTGMDGTRIRAGVIGELGTSQKIHPNEKKVLIASAKAHKETGAGIIVHTYPWTREALEILDVLSDTGADLQRVMICHIDVDIDLDYIGKIIRAGAFVEFDSFGKQYYIDKRYRGYAGLFATDLERVKAIKELADQGYISQILITCDIVFKSLLHRYGGWGYDHVLTNIVPMMHEFGITDKQIDMLLKENPKKFLTK
jgi:phosphotriesterase-related protein